MIEILKSHKQLDAFSTANRCCHSLPEEHRVQVGPTMTCLEFCCPMNINLSSIEIKATDSCHRPPETHGGLHGHSGRWLLWDIYLKKDWCVKSIAYRKREQQFLWWYWFYDTIYFVCKVRRTFELIEEWTALEFWSCLWKKVNMVASGLAWGFNCRLRCHERFRPDSWFLSGSELRPLYLPADFKRFTVLSFCSASRRHACENPET